MSLIEGIGDEVTQFFLGLLVVLVVSLAWWTTSISEQRNVETAWILDRRRHRTHRRLTNHTHSVTIAEVHFVIGTETPVESSSTSTDPVPPSEGPSVEPERVSTKPTEDNNHPSTSSASSAIHQRTEEEEQNSIVAAMDADNSVLRQRRLAFYNRSSTENRPAIDDNNARTQSESSTSSESPLMEHNYAERSASPESSTNSDIPTEASAATSRDSSDIRIKLKYINDDIKLVEGKRHEQLGDFKKRHFQNELSSNKLVRLIFNGQVLGQDTNTLEGCGFFDNCVVHCLIHQRRPTHGEDSERQAGGVDGSTSHNRNGNQNNNNQGRDWDLGNILFAIISFTLLSAWYFRYVYAHLYTVTATVGLILMTGVFTILLFGFYFPDDVPARMENASPPATPAAHQS